MFKIIKVRGIDLEVHDNGDVYSVPFYDTVGRFRPRKMRKQSNSQGYRQIGVYGSDKKAMPINVHRLVAQAFLDGWSPNLFVDHIDLNKSNNHVSNLRIVTHAENVRLYIEEQSIEHGITKTSSMPNGYKGVSKQKGEFIAMIRVGKKRPFGGKYRMPIDAAIAANALYLKHGKPLSSLNIPLRAEKPKKVAPYRHYANHYL